MDDRIRAALSLCSARLAFARREVESGALQRDLSLGVDVVALQVRHFPVSISCGFLAAIITFRGALLVACSALRALRVSNATPVLAPLAGCASVAAASCASAAIMNGTAAALHDTEHALTNALRRFVLDCILPSSASTAGAAQAAAAALPRLPAYVMPPPPVLINLTNANEPVSHSDEYAFYAGSGVLMYRLLGGAFSSVAPSDLFKPGAYAVRPHSRMPSVPASSSTSSSTTSSRFSFASMTAAVTQAAQAVYADTQVRKQLQEIGRTHGCHSCGVRRAWTWRALFSGARAPGSGGWLSWSFHADHQPPVKYHTPPHEAGALARLFGTAGGAQRFFPQCPSCSQKQAAACKSDTRTLIVHRAVRAWHAWAPAPLLWVVLQPAWVRFQKFDGREKW